MVLKLKNGKRKNKNKKYITKIIYLIVMKFNNRFYVKFSNLQFIRYYFFLVMETCCFSVICNSVSPSHI